MCISCYVLFSRPQWILWTAARWTTRGWSQVQVQGGSLQHALCRWGLSSFRRHWQSLAVMLCTCFRLFFSVEILIVNSFLSISSALLFSGRSWGTALLAGLSQEICSNCRCIQAYGKVLTSTALSLPLFQRRHGFSSFVDPCHDFAKDHCANYTVSKALVQSSCRWFFTIISPTIANQAGFLTRHARTLHLHLDVFVSLWASHSGPWIRALVRNWVRWSATKHRSFLRRAFNGRKR